MHWAQEYSNNNMRADYRKSNYNYTWYERQAKRMGRKLNLSHLSDTECRQILDVIQRDYTIRQKEKQRLSKLSKEVHEEDQKRVVLSRQQQFNLKYCICCFSSFGLIFRKRIKCSNCEFFACKDCMGKMVPAEEEAGAAAAAVGGVEEKEPVAMCLGCIQQRELQAQACEWFYGQIKSRFRRFGSAKVVRSLYKRNSDASDSGGEQSNSDSGVDQQLSPPPAAFSPTPDESSVVFMGQHGFVLVSNKQTNTDDDSKLTTKSQLRFAEDTKPSWKHSPSAATTVSIGTQTQENLRPHSNSDARSEGSSVFEDPIPVAYVDDVESSARLVSLRDEEDGLRAVFDQLDRGREDEEMMELGDEEEYDNCHLKRNGNHPHVRILLTPDEGRNDDDSSRKVKFDETPHIVDPVEGDKLHSSSIPYRILSPHDDMSSPECADTGEEVKGHRSDRSEVKGEYDFQEEEDEEDYILHNERNCQKYYSSNAYRDGAESVSPRDFDSGIHMSYCLSLDSSKGSEHYRSGSQECLLSPESRKRHADGLLHTKRSDSFDSFSSLSVHSLDNTVDSLETHYHSGHSGMTSPDLHAVDFESGASSIRVGEEIMKSQESGEAVEEECNSVEIETMSLSRSSSEETLKTENEDDVREQEMILADFLDQLQERPSSLTSEVDKARGDNNNGERFDRENNLDLRKFVPNDAKSRKNEASSNRLLYRCNSHPEFNSTEDVSSFRKEHKSGESSRSHHSKSHKSKNAYKRSKSSDDFKYSTHRRSEDRKFPDLPIRNMAEEAEANDTIGDMHQVGEKTSPTNRFIRYDSLPLVVEVCEAEYTSPTHQASDFRRLSIDYGMYDTAESEKRKHRNRRMDWQRKFSPRNSQEENDARQPSVESTTTEDTLPKSTSLSSGPTTPESDKWRRDSQALISDIENFSDCAKDLQKSPDVGYDKVPSLSDTIKFIEANKVAGYEVAEPNGNHEEPKMVARSSGKTKLTRSNPAFEHEEIPEKISKKTDPQDKSNQCDGNVDCNNLPELISNVANNISEDISENKAVPVEEQDDKEQCAEERLCADGKECSNSSPNISDSNTNAVTSNEDATDIEKSSQAKRRQCAEGTDCCSSDKPSISDQETLPCEIDMSEKDVATEGTDYCSSDKSSTTDQETSPCEIDTSEKSCATDQIESKNMNTQCETETDCNKPLTPPSTLPAKPDTPSRPGTEISQASPRTSPRISPRTSPSNCRRKDNLEIANLTKKVSMKQEEVLLSAEDVLSSANQLSDIQACVEDLETRMDCLEKSVVGSFSGESGSEDEEQVLIQDDLSPQEQVVEDVQILEMQLAKAQQVDRQTEANSATAVRLITATALKVLSTTANIIDAEHACWSVPTSLAADDSETSKVEDHQEDSHRSASTSKENRSASTSKEKKIREDFSCDKVCDEDDADVASFRDGSQEDLALLTRPATEGMHLNLDGTVNMVGTVNTNGALYLDATVNMVGTEEREPSGDGCADQKDLSPASQGAHCPEPSTTTSTRQSSYSPYGSTGFSILHIEPQGGGPLMATLLHETDVQNGNDIDYETPTASARPPVPTVRCLPTGSSQEDEDTEEKGDSLRASPVGQEDAVQAVLYEDIAELEEKVYLSASKVFTLEDRLQQLERQVDRVDRGSPEDIISDLEDSIALTMAQVAQSENQVLSVEEQIALLKRSRPTYSSTQTIDCPAKGAPHHQGISMATVNMADPAGSPFPLGVVQIEMSHDCIEADMEEEEIGEEELSLLDGAVRTAPFDDMIIRHTTGERLHEDSEDVEDTDGGKKKYTSVRNRVALFEMHISESGSSTELEPRSPTKTASNSSDMQNSETVQKVVS